MKENRKIAVDYPKYMTKDRQIWKTKLYMYPIWTVHY